MERSSHGLSTLLEIVIEHIDIPKSLYDRAAARHRSLGEWLKRESSAVRHCKPDIRPQGSFRYGTVIRPINKDDEYDLDNVCLLTTLGKLTMTQQQVKTLYGEEIKAYAREHGMLKPVEEHHRCWRLRYADEVSFHLDTLPCVPEEAVLIQRLVQAGVTEELARRAVAITDRRHPQYEEITMHWPSSNPRGFAAFFEQRAALGLRRKLPDSEFRATLEDVPPYEWKTTLQRSIQLLKRHRDVMFRRSPELAPISMIITNLAARAYEGETDIATALMGIVDRMPNFVRADSPRVPNPADPAEDYADKWSRNQRLEKSFRDWYYMVKSDLARLARLLGTSEIRSAIDATFDVSPTRQELRILGADGLSSTSVAANLAPAFVIPSAAKPWGGHG